MVKFGNAKKVSILEQILDERDEQIQTLRDENAKLKAELDAYSDRNIQNDIDELRDIITETRKLNREYDAIANENKVIGNCFFISYVSHRRGRIASRADRTICYRRF